MYLFEGIYKKGHDALRDQDYLISRTSLCLWKDELVGYFTLTTVTIQVKDVINKDDYKNKYRYFPAMKIARLAVDSRFERRGIGKHMLFAAIGKVWSIRESVACRYILIDFKIDSIGFYERNGFRKIEKSKQKRFYPFVF
jgi:ribosomal protein S18 acetylase RimI-like enzyme